MDPKFLPLFSGWLRTLGDDVLSLANLLEAAPIPAAPEVQAPAGDVAASGDDAPEHHDAAAEHHEPAEAAEAPAPPDPVHRASAESLHLLLRAADLIPDGLEHLGYLEVAFAFRAIARRALDDSSQAVGEAGDTTPEGPIARLGADAELIAEFLDSDVGAFYEAVSNIGATRRDGHTAAALLKSSEVRGPALQQARRWVERYQSPELSDRHEELVKIRSFFRTRLERSE